MKEVITDRKVKAFLTDFQNKSETLILETSKDKKELYAIAKARGIVLKDSIDLAGFKTIYTFANKANDNNTRLPKAKLLKALPTLVGKPVNVDHTRGYVVGHYIDYKYHQKEDMVVAYGVFYKSNFGKEWELAKKLFKSKVLATSYEVWCPEEKRKELADGTIELQNIEIAGGALLFATEPAFKDAKVLELAKKNMSTQADLVFASKYNDKDLIVADYFKDSVKENVERVTKEREAQKEAEPKPVVKETPKVVEKKVEPKKEEPKPVVKKEEPKKVEPKEEVKKVEPKKEDKKVEIKKEEKPEEPVKPPEDPTKVTCSNCQESLVKSEMAQIKCPKCLAIINQTGQMIHPPQIMDFRVTCTACKSSNWLILAKTDEDAKLRCMSCAKEFNLEFQKNSKDNKKLLEKFHFVYTGHVNCNQCHTPIKVQTLSTLKDINVKCPKCKLAFSFNIEREQYRTVSAINEIVTKKIEKSSKIGGKQDMKSKEKKVVKASVKELPLDMQYEAEIEAMGYTVEKAKAEYNKELASKGLDKMVKKVVDLNKELQTAKKQDKKASEKEELLKAGVKKAVQQLMEVKKTSKETVEFYKANAKKIYDRRTTLGDFGTKLSDEQIIDDKDFEIASLKKKVETEKEKEVEVNKIDVASSNAGDKDTNRSDEEYTVIRDKIDAKAFKNKKDK